MRPLRTLAFGLIVALLTLLAVAQQSQGTPRYRWYRAYVVCPGQRLTEDSAAHVRLRVFDRNPDGSVRVVYRCERTGY